FYADSVTDSMRSAIDEVERRRKAQLEYNAANGITPQTILKPVRESIEALYEMDYVEVASVDGDRKRGKGARDADPALTWEPARLRGEIEKLRADMLHAASEMRFEDAAKSRDRLKELEAIELAH